MNCIRSLFTLVHLLYTLLPQNVSIVLYDLVGLTLASASYSYAFKNLRLFTIDVKKYPWLTFVTMLLGKDLGYYWSHRFFHEFHLPWAGHSVHHSGEDYTILPRR